MSGFGYETWPPFQIEWSDGALAGVLHRINALDHMLNMTVNGEEMAPEAKEHFYAQRNGLVWCAIWLAQQAGYGVGVRVDKKEPAWPVVFIELPSGQVSWHLPEHNIPWDKHTTEDKLDRVQAFVEQQLEALGAPQLAADAERYGEAVFQP